MRESFRKKYEEAAARLLPGKQHPFGEMLNLLFIIKTLGELPKDKLTVLDADFLSVYQRSQNAFDKEKDSKK